MDQMKTGKFISQLRKERGLTQAQLAEVLGITDRAVSKWETGRCLPDSAIMLELCEFLGINVNELLCGERLAMENYEKKFEENLIELKRQKEETDKRMLRLEYVVGYSASISFFILIFVASFINMQAWVRILLIAFGIIQFMVAMFYALKIEQTAGYYECQSCRYKYVPEYKSVFLAMHMGRTRYMKCPHCGKRSWQKKVVSKD